MAYRFPLELVERKGKSRFEPFEYAIDFFESVGARDVNPPLGARESRW